jgi:Kef-type K+ transport system membrane component KefB
MEFLPQALDGVSPMIVFGLLLMAGALGGYIAHRLTWLPSITGFMLVGFLIGPSGLGVLSYEAMNEARAFIDVALGLILYRLGLSLNFNSIAQSPQVIIVSLVESAGTFLSVWFVLHLLSVPLVVAALVAAIVISSSPAVLLHVAHEVGAKGIVTEQTKTLLALNNCLSFFAFSAILPLMHYSSGSDLFTIIFQPLYRLLGSVALGMVMGFLLHQLVLRTLDAGQYHFAMVIGVIVFTIGLASLLNLSVLLSALAMGATVSTLEKEKLTSGIEFGSAFELFFILLFVFAGAGLHLAELVDFAPVVLGLVLVRMLVKVFSVAAVARIFSNPWHKGTASGLLLVPMAGLAIGLVQTTNTLFTEHAKQVSAIVLGAVAVFETIGPPIAKYAFRLCGEDAVDKVANEQVPGEV